MIYEVQITYVTVDNKGNDKNVKNNLIVQNAISFADAEETVYKYGDGLTNIDVVSIKRSKLKEIVNENRSTMIRSRFMLHKLLTILLTWKQRKQKTSSIP